MNSLTVKLACLMMDLRVLGAKSFLPNGIVIFRLDLSMWRS